MTRRLLLSFFISFMALQVGLSQGAMCPGPFLPCNTFCSVMPDSGPNGPFPLCPGQPNTAPHNTHWFRLVLETSGIFTITITPSDCASGSGLQGGIYDNCNFDNALDCNGACNSTSFSLTVNLAAGVPAFLFIDGCNGEVCDYILSWDDTGPQPEQAPTFPNGVPTITSPNLTGPPYQICSDGSAVLPEFQTEAIEGSCNTNWTISPTLNAPLIPSADQLSVQLDPTGAAPGIYLLCATANNNCGNSTPGCVPIQIAAPPAPVDRTLRYCYPWDQDPSTFGVFFKGQFYTVGNYFVTEPDAALAGCDSTFNLTVLPFPEYNPLEVEVDICADDLPFSYNGQAFPAFTNTGQYPFFPSPPQTMNGVCDSNLLFDLLVLDPIVEFTQPVEVLNCEQDTIFLDASPSLAFYPFGHPRMPITGPQITWTGLDGQTIPNPVGPGIIVTEPGTYQVEIAYITNNGLACLAIDSIEVIQDTIPPDLAMSAVNPDCTNPLGSATVTPSNGSGSYLYAWDDPNAQTDPTATDLSFGTYCVAVTELPSQCEAVDCITLSDPGGVSISSVDGPGLACFGDTNGTATVNGTGGTTPYTYIWENGNTVATATNLTAGTWTVTVTDALGCVAIDSVTIVQPDELVLSVGVVDVDCNGSASGSATTTVVGGVGPYVFTWSTPSGNTTGTEGSLIAGNYGVTVTDNNGCEDEMMFTVGQPSALALVLGSESTLCNGSADGTAVVTPSGGSGNYTYQWEDGQTDSLAIDLPAGTWTVTVSDGQGCEGIDSIIVDQPAELTLSTTQANVDCNGDATGSATVVPDGGTAPYTFLWNDPSGQTTATASNLAAGAVTVLVTDFNGCQESIEVTITQPDVIAVTQVTIDDVLCRGDATGSIDIEVTGGIAPYTYDWSGGGGTNQDPQNLLAGTYTLIITDANNCTFTDNYNIAEPPTNISATSVSFDAVCGEANGSIDLTPAGGVGPYTYQWSNTDTDEDPADLGAGTYIVTITDANNCTFVYTEAVAAPNSPFEADRLVEPASCNGEADGSISVTIQDGLLPYTIDWSDDTYDGLTDLTGLAAGNYTLTVTDGNGCSIELSYAIDEPEVLTVAATSAPAGCSQSNGSITIVVDGGNGGYQFDWTEDTVDGIQNPTGLPAGTYSVTVTDSEGCTAETTTDIINPDAPVAVLDSALDADCNGDATGAISITITGGQAPYDFDWNDDTFDGIEDPTNVPAGSYDVIVTDANNCVTTLSAVIDEPTELVVVIDDVQVATCGQANGVISVTVSGGTTPYSYDWSDDDFDGTEDPNGLTPGNYTLIVTDGNGCTAMVDASVTEPGALEASLDGTDINCNGDITGAIDVQTMGGMAPYTYDWQDLPGTNDPDVRTDLAAGIYTLIVTDADDCEFEVSITLTEPDVLELATTATEAGCQLADGTINLTVTGGTGPYQYDWSLDAFDGTEDPDAVPAGDYTVIVTDANNCTAEIMETVSNPNAPVAALDVVEDALCRDEASGSISISITGGTPPYSYDWSDDQYDGIEDPTAVLMGTYNVIVTDASNCSVSLTDIIVDEPEALVVSGSPAPVSCNGGTDGSVLLTVSGGTGAYTFDWSDDTFDGQEDPSTMPAGLYDVTVTDENGCSTAFMDISVNEPPALDLAFTATDALCNGDANGTAILTPSGGTPGGGTIYFYDWSDDAFDGQDAPIDLPAGTYTVTLSDANGCELISDPIIIEEPAVLDLATTATIAGCQLSDGTIDLTVTGGTAPYVYDWSEDSFDGTEDPDALPAGDYDVIVTDANGCIATISQTVSNPPDSPQASAVASPVDCNSNSTGSIAVDVVGGIAPYTYDWDDDAFDGEEDPIDMPAGVYNLIVTDANNCSTTVQAEVTEPTVLEVASSILPASCFDGADGSINLVITGGTGPYTVDWSDDAFDGQENPTTMPFGTYDYVVTDANGCTFQDQGLVVDQPDDFSFDFQVENVLCNGESSGSLSISIDGGTAPYTFDWSDDQYDGIEDLVDIAQGGYLLTITDANGCTFVSNQIDVTEPEVLAVAVDGTTEAGCNLSDGTAAITVSGGTGPYSYDWSEDSFDGVEDPDALPAGDYDVVVTDDNGCSATAQLTIVNPDAPIVQAGGTPVSCFGENSGTISLTITGGEAPYTYDWNDDSLDGLENPPEVFAGAYDVVVTDANNCSGIASITISEPQPLELVVDDIQVATCGEANGSVMVTASGGTAPYTYDWSDDDFDGIEDPNTFRPGSYILIVSDANGCTTEIEASVTEPGALEAALSGSDVSCNGGADGTVAAVATGGNGPYTYDWQDVMGTDNPAIRTDLPAGTYIVIVTDADDCEFESSFTVNEPDVLEAVLIPESASCLDNDGSIAVSITGGTGPFSYDWSDDTLDGQDNVNNLASGSYTLIVTDNNDCTFEATTTVGIPTPAALAISGTNISCNPANPGNADSDGTISLEITGGLAPFTYDWNFDPADGEQNPTGLPAGDYEVTVTDALNCVTIQTITLTQPQPIEILTSQSNQATCGDANGSIDITVTGGSGNYSFEWDNMAGNDEDPQGLLPGTYNVTVTDDNGCSIVDVFSVSTPVELLAQGAFVEPSCNGGSDGSLSVTVTGGTAPFTYDWSDDQFDGIQNPTGVSAGPIVVLVVDANGCEFTVPFDVTEPDPLEVQLVNSVNATCGSPNGSLDIDVIGGTAPYTYAWDNSSTNQDPNNLDPGSYTVIVTDANDCTVTGVFSVSTPTALEVTSTPSSVACNGESTGGILVDVTGGTAPFEYDWNVDAFDGQEDLTNVPAGIYDLIVTDSDGCEFAITTEVTEPDAIAVAVVENDALCNGEANGSIDLTVTGGVAPYSYAWDGGLPNQEDPQNVLSGVYTVVITDANGCTFQQVVNIGQPAAIQLALGGQDLSCNGSGDGLTDLTVNGGTAPYTYIWNSGETTQNITDLDAGTYTVVVTDANGCSDNAQVSIAEPAAIALEFTTSSFNGFNLTCFDAFDGSASVAATGGTGPYTFDWSTGVTGTSIADLGPGAYTVIATDARGCTMEDQVILVAPEPINAVLSGLDPTCFGDDNGQILVDLVAGGSAPYRYSLDGENYGQTGVFISLAPDVYDVYVQDANGCETVLQYEIEEARELTLEIEVEPENSTDVLEQIDNSWVISLGDSVTLQPEANISTDAIAFLEWTGVNPLLANEFNQGLRPTEPGRYTLTIEDENGCQAEATVTIQVSKERNVFIPNAFSPDGDSNNDFFEIFIGPGVTQIKRFQVFTRWGELVHDRLNFIPGNVGDGWDGLFKGERMNPGVYVYFVEVEFDDGLIEVYKGDVTLLR